MPRRIVVVEDERFAAKIVKFVLNEEGYEVVSASSASKAFDEIIGRETDLVLLDVNLPGISGFELCAELRARRYTGPVIFVTGQCDVASKVEGFHVGCDDYIVKPYDPSELIARVDNVIRRYRSSDQQALGSIVRVGDTELSVSSFTYSSSTVDRIELAPTEMRLIECLMRNSGIVLSRESLIERIWGYDYLGDSNRVDVYIRRLRSKIEPDPTNPVYIRTVRGLGYVFRPKQSSNGASTGIAAQIPAIQH